MNCDEIRERLDELVADAPESAERRRIESHLDDCPDCRGELAGLRELRRQLAGLADEIEPRRDLWPGIEREIGGGHVVDPRFGNRRGSEASADGSWRRWGLLAAAAMLLMALSSGLTAWWMSAEPADNPGPAGVALAQMSQVERHYERLTDDLLTALDARRDSLDSETVRVVAENLEIINDAIEEMRTALRRNPANAGLASQLTTAYRKRIELLRKANEITT